jgi:asparagine synthase (glutamine-hydrolysing)
MCGIAGIISKEGREPLQQAIKKMTDSISHRGPDGEGFFIDEHDGIALGHRRLSIIDLSHEAGQPMRSEDGRYLIIFNGEIYNYIEVKEVLEKKGVVFHTSSDTEVLLEAYIQDKEQCLLYLDAMFAFAIYDTVERSLFCARDRFGEKPFHYVYEPGKRFIFGSEIKAIRTLGGYDDINQKMLFNFLAFGTVTMPNESDQTFFEKIRRLPPASYCTVSADGLLQIKKYWDIEVREDMNLPFESAREEFAHLLQTSVKRRLRSDVPVGSSLSGGLDSSIIVSIIDKLNKEGRIQQNTFSAKFPGFEKDESYYIDKVIAHINVKGHFTYPDEEGFINAFDKLCYHQDEPFGSASIFAQWEVMSSARQHNVTVLLDGQGADEILAGYHGYYTPFFQELLLNNKKTYREQWQKYKELQAVPIARDFKFYGGVYLTQQKKYFGWLKDFLDNRFKKSFNKDFFSAYKQYSVARRIDTQPSLNHTLYQSVTDGRLETLLRIADRNSMAHSREVRLPFLSHEVVEFLFSLPSSYKIVDGWTKYIARKAFDPIMPKEITWRKDKVGYEPPQKRWMKNKKVQDLIAESKSVLIKNHILTDEVMKQGVVASSASERGDNSWNYLMAGKLFGL